MLIKTGYPNFVYDCDFLCFNLNCSWVWEDSDHLCNYSVPLWKTEVWPTPVWFQWRCSRKRWPMTSWHLQVIALLLCKPGGHFKYAGTWSFTSRGFIFGINLRELWVKKFRAQRNLLIAWGKKSEIFKETCFPPSPFGRLSMFYQVFSKLTQKKYLVPFWTVNYL